MSTLSRIFKSEVQPAVFSQEAAAGNQQRANMQLTAALSNVNTNVCLNLREKIDPSKPGAQALAECAKAATVKAQENLQGQINAAFEGIAAAQNEIMAAVAVTGMQVEDVFPPKSFESDGPGAIIFSAALQSKMGAGSLMTFNKAMDKAGTVRDVQFDRTMPADEKIAAVADILSQASQRPETTQTANFGHITNANQPTQMENQTAVNWKEIFQDASPEQTVKMMKAIMHFNPNDPDPGFFNDLAKMVDANDQATKYIEYLKGVEAEAERQGTPYYGADESLAISSVTKIPRLALCYKTGTFTPDHVAAQNIAGTIGEVTKTEKPPTFDNDAGLKELAVKAADFDRNPDLPKLEQPKLNGGMFT